MADNAIAAQVDVNPLKTYSQILGVQQQATGLAQQRQQLQTGAYLQQSAQAEAIQRQQAAHEMQAGVPLLQDPVGSGLVDEDGTPTKQAQQVLARAMPTTWHQHYENLMGAAQSKVQLQNSFLGMSNEARNIVTSRVAGVAADGKSGTAEILNAIDDAEEQYRGTPDEKPVSKAAQLLREGIGKIKDKGLPVVKQYVLAANRGGIGPSGLTGAGGVATPTPSTLDVGGQMYPGVTQPALEGGGFAPSGQQFNRTLAPQVGVVTDAYGRQFRYNAQTNQLEPVGAGGGGGVGVGVGGGPPTAGGPRFTQPVPGQAEAQQHIELTRQADADYGVNRHINDQILRLSKDTATGPGTEVWHHALGAIAGPMGGNNVSDYQTISAYLDRQAALSTKQMGLPETNAGLATAAGLSGTTRYQPEALQTKVRLTDALVEGAHNYRQGLDRAIGTGPNQDLTRYQAFRQAWASNFDPTVFALDNAHKRGDKAEADQILKNLTPAQAKDLRQKAQNLRMLARGELPQ